MLTFINVINPRKRASVPSFLSYMQECSTMPTAFHTISTVNPPIHSHHPTLRDPNLITCLQSYSLQKARDIKTPALSFCLTRGWRFHRSFPGSFLHTFIQPKTITLESQPPDPRLWAHPDPITATQPTVPSGRVR